MKFRHFSLALLVVFSSLISTTACRDDRKVRSTRKSHPRAPSAVTAREAAVQEPSEWTALVDSYVSGLEVLATRSATARTALTLYRNHAIRAITDRSGNLQVVLDHVPSAGFLVTVNDRLPQTLFAAYDEQTQILTINAKRHLESLVGGSVLAHELRHAFVTNGGQLPHTSREKVAGEVDAYYRQAEILHEYTGGDFTRIIERVITRMLREGPHEDGFDTEHRELVALFPPRNSHEDPFPYRLMLTFVMYKYHEHTSPTQEVFLQRLEQRRTTGPAASEFPTSPSR